MIVIYYNKTKLYQMKVQLFYFIFKKAPTVVEAFCS